MSPSRGRAVLCTVLVAALGAPATAQAAEKTVDVGVPRESQRAFQNAFSDVNAFFPSRITINVGDTVRFVPSGFHNVDLPGRRTRKLPLIVPVGPPIAGAVDAAGAPFWFNGQRTVGFNPRLLRSIWGQRRAYTGARALNSGLPLEQRPGSLRVRFTRAGTYRYFCDVHYGMTGQVRVLRRGRAVPSRSADARTVRRQVQAGLANARSLPQRATQPPATVDVGLQGRRGVTWFGFDPAQMTVSPGTTVTFRMPVREEVHTATTGPGNPENEPNSYLGQLTASLERPVFDPRAVLPSEPPGTLAALTPTFHGNGFWNSGVMDRDPSTPPGAVSRVTFAAPGTYQIYCIIHPFMHGTVTVQ